MSDSESPSRSRVPSVLVVDDESDLRELLGLTIARMGLDVDTAESLAEARQFLQAKSYRLCLTDMRLPDGSGLDLVRELGARGEPKIAVITAFGSADNAVAALKAGAFDYLAKPVDLDQLRLLIRSALGEGAAASPGGGAPNEAVARLVGESPEIARLRGLIDRLSQSMAPVAIIGESGSGKELVARAIHAGSARRAMPFVAVNCGAIPESLMEAEFFGYRRGAFTGADRDRDGFFQAASGGTLLLDEVAELPLAMQVKLLRAIQERRIHKVGSTSEESVDVRILSATHQDLARMVESGRFRQDLFYRLNVITIDLPPLRQRRLDVPLLCEHFIKKFCEENNKPLMRMTPEALRPLLDYNWQGNVRELENVIERAVVLANGPNITMDLLPDNVVGRGSSLSFVETRPDASLFEIMEDCERRIIVDMLEKVSWNQTDAAERFHIPLSTLNQKIKRLSIEIKKKNSREVLPQQA